MLVTMALMLQAAPPAVIDLLVAQPPACRLDDNAEAYGDDIVVCARKGADARFRLGPLPDMAEPQLLPKAETSLAGGTLSAETETAAMPQGQVSKRAMVRFRIPL